MSELDDPDDVVARHEAGHAVASYLLRGFVGTVTIEPPSVGKLGGTEVWVLKPPLVDEAGRIVVPKNLTAGDEQAYRDAAAITVAGPVAETIYWPFRSYPEALMKNPDDQAKLDSIVRKVWPAEHARAEESIARASCCLLRGAWDALERLADALEAERTLDGVQAAALINGN